MPVIEKRISSDFKPNSDFKPFPKGEHIVKCTNAEEREFHDEKYNKDKDQIRFIFESPDGQKLFSRWMTLSLHEKASLSEFFKEWLGKVPTKIDTDTLIGKDAKVFVAHVKSDDGEKTFANIKSIEPVEDDDVPF